MTALPDEYLRAILAYPDDDGPRLVAADWWDEQGVCSRAEFVRVQCELEAHPIVQAERQGKAGIWKFSQMDCVRALRRREGELFAAVADEAMHAGRGLWGLPWRVTGWSLNRVNMDDAGLSAEFRRGFVEVVTCAAADWLAHAGALTAAAPLRRVRLTTWPGLRYGNRANGAPIVTLDGIDPVRHAADGNWPEYVAVPRLLAAEWPGVTFELPAAERRDSAEVERLTRRVREAGRRAALEQERRFMDAFLRGADGP